jgi:hypothetical protein
MKNSGRKTTKSVTGHGAFVAHPFERLQNCVVAHRFGCVEVAWKYPFAAKAENPATAGFFSTS